MDQLYSHVRYWQQLHTPGWLDEPNGTAELSLVCKLLVCTYNRYCCLKCRLVVDSDELIVAYWGKKQDRNSTGARAFQRQLYQCMIAQGVSLSQNIQQRRGGGAGAQDNSLGLLVPTPLNKPDDHVICFTEIALLLLIKTLIWGYL